MKKIFLTVLFCSCFSSIGFADVKFDMMNDKLVRLENDVNALQRKIYKSQQDSNVTASAEVVPQNLDSLYNRITQQESVIQELTSKVEKLEFEQKQLLDKLNKINADNDIRFSMIENKQASSTKEAESKPVSSKNDQKAYDEAYNLMKKGDYVAAEASFLAFMKEYPKSKFVGNANYWLGETYYARGLFEQAVGVFADGFTKYKNNTKAADNLLKLGLTMNKLNKKQEACTAFKSLPTEFPKAPKNLKDRASAEAKKLLCK